MNHYTCPTCNHKVIVFDRLAAPYRPFCSRRCQLLDLAKWFNEEYRIETAPTPPDFTSANGTAFPDYSAFCTSSDPQVESDA
ncbi:MAG: DNA gyrase inhibitor YacG [Phycisphaerae bacterium]|nr:DNA gyrase inhibitor YacG [Phycisphaerae bacterium]